MSKVGGTWHTRVLADIKLQLYFWPSIPCYHFKASGSHARIWYLETTYQSKHTNFNPIIFHCSFVTEFKAQCFIHVFAVTENEITHGIFNNTQIENTCLCVMRNIPDIEKHITEPKAPKFIDLQRSDVSSVSLVIRQIGIWLKIEWTRLKSMPWGRPQFL